MCAVSGKFTKPRQKKRGGHNLFPGQNKKPSKKEEKGSGQEKRKKAQQRVKKLYSNTGEPHCPGSMDRSLNWVTDDGGGTVHMVRSGKKWVGKRLTASRKISPR